jgi:hypothetical protein
MLNINLVQIQRITLRLGLYYFVTIVDFVILLSLTFFYLPK